jgi:CRP/FNR family transcriptional regulator, cyclic AMP receptor protein
MARKKPASNPKTILSTVGPGRSLVFFEKGQRIFVQGDTPEALFVIQKRMVRLRVKSQAGKETTLDILSDGDFIGEDSIAGQSSCTSSATAMTDCSLLRIEKKAILPVLTSEVKLANTFLAYVLASNLRYQQHLVDHRCNPGEKRLARILSLLAHFDRHGSAMADIPNINQETLAEMVGTTRSRVSFFMNRFRQSGFIDYKRGSAMIRVHRTILAFYASG